MKPRARLAGLLSACAIVVIGGCGASPSWAPAEGATVVVGNEPYDEDVARTTAGWEGRLIEAEGCIGIEDPSGARMLPVFHAGALLVADGSDDSLGVRMEPSGVLAVGTEYDGSAFYLEEADLASYADAERCMQALGAEVAFLLYDAEPR